MLQTEPNNLSSGILSLVKVNLLKNLSDCIIKSPLKRFSRLNEFYIYYRNIPY